MADFKTLVSGALVTKLTGDSNVNTWSGGRIVEAPALDGTAYPFIAFTYMSGNEDILTPRRQKTFMILVDCWDTNRANADLGAGYVDSALHGGELIISGWSNWFLEAQGMGVLPPELVAGQLIYRSGDVWRVTLDKNSIP